MNSGRKFFMPHCYEPRTIWNTATEITLFESEQFVRFVRDHFFGLFPVLNTMLDFGFKPVNSDVFIECWMMRFLPRNVGNVIVGETKAWRHFNMAASATEKATESVFHQLWRH